MNSKSYTILIILVVLAGMAIWKVKAKPIVMQSMQIESSAFGNNDNIPVLYTCNGDNAQPPLFISNVRKEAKSLSLIVHDPDAPMAGGFTHWVVWNIPPTTTSIEGGQVRQMPSAKEGITGLGKPGWVAPCPPSGVHHYYFKLYALDTLLDLPDSTDKDTLEEAMAGHILESVTLLGLYGKN